MVRFVRYWYKILIMVRFNFIGYLNMVWIALFAVFVVSCAETVEPTNLEPIIKNLKASEIERTSAKLSAEIELRGSGMFDTFHFEYCSQSGDVATAGKVMKPSGKYETQITGLTPGCSYTFKGVGIRNAAVVESETMSFSTIPNEIPKVSQISEVSVGPTAIIVKFEIVSDGGDPITESGCYIGNPKEDSSVSVKSEDSNPENAVRFVFIDSLEKLTEYVIYPYAKNAVGETIGEAYHFSTKEAVSIKRAGDLEKILAGASLKDGSLTISGSLNGDDFKYLRQLLSASVENLDISDVTIVEGGSSFDGSRFIKNNVITTGLFSDCSVMESVILPNSATEIERNAFSGSGLLRSIAISAGVSALLPSSDCISLEHLSVSEANRHFKEYDGVVYNVDMTVLVWYPGGKTGKLTLPPSMSEIGESAFAKSKIEYISLPENIRVIGRCAFEGSMLKEIEIPDNLRNISEGLLQNCPQLKKVVLGKSTEYVGNYVLDNTDVKDLFVLSVYPPYATALTFGNNPGLYESCTLHVPAGCKSLYKNHQFWGLFKNIYE